MADINAMLSPDAMRMQLNNFMAPDSQDSCDLMLTYLNQIIQQQAHIMQFQDSLKLQVNKGQHPSQLTIKSSEMGG